MELDGLTSGPPDTHMHFCTPYFRRAEKKNRPKQWTMININLILTN